MTPLPLPVDWSEPYVEDWEWLTEIIESESGREQRRSRRLLPRHSINFRATDLQGRDRLRRQQAAGGMSDLLIMADEVRRTTLSTAAFVNDTTLSVAAADWLSAARWLVVEIDGVRQALEVASVAGTTVTLEDALPFDIAAGRTLRLGLVSRLSPQQTIQMLSNEISRGSVAIQVEPGDEVLVQSSAPTTFNGREVLLHRPDWSEPLGLDFADSLTFVDAESGVRSPYRRREWTRETHRVRHLLRSTADQQAFIGAFHRARGRQGELYRPSWFNDFPLSDAVSSGSKFWRTEGKGFANAYAHSPVYKAIAVVMRSGTVHLFQIAEITSGGSTSPWSMIETVTGAPAAINPADAAMICLMPVVRFGSDTLSVQWLTHTIARVQTSFITLEDL